MAAAAITGSFMQRARKSEKATQKLGEQRKRRAAAKMHETLAQFEDALQAEEREFIRAFDDIPDQAEDRATQLARHFRECGSLGGTGKLGTSLTQTMGQSQSQPLPPLEGRRHYEVEHDPCSQRPPSPLSFYDYGGVSLKPRSIFGQHRQRMGESVRSKHRQKTAHGFYFPGAHFKQGPYGFSMLDPHLMPPRATAPTKPPLHFSGDTADVRPLAMESFSSRKPHRGRPVVSDVVRANVAHSRRSERVFQHLDNARGEAALEHARFEHGVFEGRWRDPLLDSGGAVPEETSLADLSWLDLPDVELSPVQLEAAYLLFKIEAVNTRSKAGLASVFAAENNGNPGVLEPTDFMRGLARLGAVEHDELTLDNLIRILLTIDPSFNGRVSVPALDRAVKYTRSIRMRREQEAEHAHRQRHQRLATCYIEELPCEVVKVEREMSSLLNYNRAVTKFRGQQRQLLEHHGEMCPFTD